MRPEDACVRAMLQNEAQEQQLLDTILEECTSSHSRKSNAGSVSGVLQVPSIDVTLSEEETNRHEDRLRTISQEIDAIGRTSEAKVAWVKQENALKFAASKCTWDKTIQGAADKMRESQASLEAMGAKAHDRFVSMTQAFERLRADDMAEVATNQGAEGPRARPDPRLHANQGATHLITKRALHPRYLEQADAVIRWLANSGIQATHAANQFVDLAIDKRPAILAHASKQIIRALEIELSSTPGPQWPDLRVPIANILSKQPI